MSRITLAAFVALTAFSAQAADNELAASKPIANFQLADHRGREWSLDEFRDKQLVVIGVTGTECPLAKKYLPEMQKLSDEFAEKGVAFIGLNANRQDSLAEIGAQVRDAAVTFPVLKDNQQTVIKALGATRTPEVFVLDKDRVVRYQGRIDDQHATGGRSKNSPVRQDLRLAIDELLAGQEVSMARTPATGCLITKLASPKADAEITYSNQISRLLNKHCVECHRTGEIAPFSLTDYSEVVGWAEMIVETTQSGQMPPWHASPEHGRFQNTRGLSDEEKQLLVAWVAAGTPEGDPKNLPEAPTYTTGWQLPQEPDFVVAMRKEPFQVPAEGTVKYQYFTIDLDLKEDKWIKAAEIIPGNRAVVHHVIVFAIGGGKLTELDRGMVTAYVPGFRPEPLPPGYAKRLPAGSRLIFQMHYTTNGTAQEDLTKIGLVFADDKEVTNVVRTESVKNRRFVLRPEKDDQRIDAKPLTAPTDLELLSLSPHMHLRGKSFRYELTWPDGRRETLLDVPNYDFNWQTTYRLEQPLNVPAGATLYAYASYDNSSNNLANPDPTKSVTWGEQSWDEMMLGYFDIAVPRELDDKTVPEKIADAMKPEIRAARWIKVLDRNRNGTVERDEVREGQRFLFDRVDADKNGIVTVEELAAGGDQLRNR